MKKLNDKVKSIIVLTLICLIVTGVLAVTNSFTSPVIEKSRAVKVKNSLMAVLPGSSNFSEVELPEGAPSTVKAVYKADDGSYAVVLGTMSSYSSGEMGVTCGISAHGELVGVTLTSYRESKDFGKDTYPKTYIGVNENTYADVDTFAGVTYSSNAFKKAIGDAFAVVRLLKGGEAQ
ncbi:MAG: FMN-binding protein [Clostridiales bacterium]|nr:FMN-binding protein [Clostridiales bacterium]